MNVQRAPLLSVVRRWSNASVTPPGPDAGLDSLSDLHGQTPFIDGTGEWVRLAALRTEVTAKRPHGLSRSPELHAPDRIRRGTFGNAHPVRGAQWPGMRRCRKSDHGHRMRTQECGDATMLPGDVRKEANAGPRERRVIP